MGKKEYLQQRVIPDVTVYDKMRVSLSSHRPYIREEPKVGRNDACPCGCGEKFKKCKNVKSLKNVRRKEVTQWVY